VKDLDDAYIAYLEDLIRHVLNAYPHCLWNSKYMLYKSILTIILAVRKQNADQLLMNRIVHHLLLLTVSNVTDARDMVRVELPLNSLQLLTPYTLFSIHVGHPVSPRNRKRGGETSLRI
jgi:hypothetical protein